MSNFKLKYTLDIPLRFTLTWDEFWAEATRIGREELETEDWQPRSLNEAIFEVMHAGSPVGSGLEILRERPAEGECHIAQIGLTMFLEGPLSKLHNLASESDMTAALIDCLQKHTRPIDHILQIEPHDIEPLSSNHARIEERRRYERCRTHLPIKGTPA